MRSDGCRMYLFVTSRSDIVHAVRHSLLDASSGNCFQEWVSQDDLGELSEHGREAFPL
jgi:hypothetical protein